MQILIHPHAFKHGLTAEQILHAYRTPARGATRRWRDRDAEPPRWALIGFDTEARLVELVFTTTIDDEVLIFHANWLTEGFRKEIERGLHR